MTRSEGGTATIPDDAWTRAEATAFAEIAKTDLGDLLDDDGYDEVVACAANALFRAHVRRWRAGEDG